MISKQAKYALRALIALAHLPAGESMQTARIASQERIPKKFLEQILLTLKRQGMVQSSRGSQGGYALLKPAKAISITQVLRVIDGPIAPLPCLSIVAYSRCPDCPDENACRIRRAFAPVAESHRRILDRTMLSDLASDAKTGGGTARRKAALS
ncbi:MAG: Rrf2 family transcriptional regulator [Pseudomonadota bacterium]|nr:Rrf2 family transcriptional regulator [Pseudomonadota bacterium]